MRIRIPVKEFDEGLHEWGREVLAHFDDHPEIRRRVLVWHRRARKTSLALNLLIRECMRTENRTYAYVSPTFRQSKGIVWRDPMMLRRYLPEEILSRPFNETELIGNFLSGSVLHIGGADNPDRWRGMGCYGWILDEFALMKNGKELYEEIIYPIIRENGGWVMMLFTPKGRNHGWEYYQKAEMDKDWKLWFLPVDKSKILSDKDIAIAKEEMPAHLFAQEFMCEFMEGGGGIIKRVEEAIQGTLEKANPTKRYVMGVDLGKKEDWTVLSVLDRDTRHLVAWERFQKFDWTFQKEKIVRLAKEYFYPLVIMDTTGLGDPVEDDLKRMGLNIRGFKFTASSKKRIIEKLILAIEDRRITYPEIRVLIDELQDFDIDEKGRYSAPKGLHDDSVVSLALAVEGLGADVYVQTTSRRPHRREEEAVITRNLYTGY